MSNFWVRLLSGAGYVSIVLAAVLHSDYALLMLIFVFGALCLWEYFNWFKKQYSQVILAIARILGLGALTLLLGSLYLPSYTHYYPLFLMALPLLSVCTLYLPSGKFLSFMGKSLLGWGLIITPVSSIILLLIASSKFGNYYLLFFFIAIWTNDTGAYLSGRSFGKNPLFPRISPKKTWEGLIGGIILTLLFAIGFNLFNSNASGSLLFDLGFAAIIAFGGTFGDLVESALKRELGIKDSGKIMPGHGGILDRLDGVLMAAPLAYAYFYFCHSFVS